MPSLRVFKMRDNTSSAPNISTGIPVASFSFYYITTTRPCSRGRIHDLHPVHAHTRTAQVAFALAYKITRLAKQSPTGRSSALTEPTRSKKCVSGTPRSNFVSTLCRVERERERNTQMPSCSTQYTYSVLLFLEKRVEWAALSTYENFLQSNKTRRGPTLSLEVRWSHSCRMCSLVAETSSRLVL